VAPISPKIICRRNKRFSLQRAEIGSYEIKNDTEIINCVGVGLDDIEVSEVTTRTESDSVESCLGIDHAVKRNSVFEGLIESRLEAIQEETLDIVVSK
jgi:hypothetical protein